MNQSKIFKALLLTTSFSLLSATAYAKDFLSAQDYTKSGLRGFNIGLLSEHDDAYYKELSATNANIVRVILPFNFCTAKDMSNQKIKVTEEKDISSAKLSPTPSCVYEVSSKNQDMLKKLLTAGTQYGFYVLPVGTFAQKTQGDFWTDAHLQQGMVDAWKNFAKQYKDYSTIAGYDLLYSPNNVGLPQGADPKKYWKQGATYMIKAIREVDKKHPVIFETTPYADPTTLSSFTPFDDDNIVYAFNMYYPYDITLQGTSESYGYRVPYPAGLEYGVQPFPDQPPRAIDIKDLRLYLKDAAVWGVNNKVPVLVTEFGIAHWAPNGSAFRYTSDVTKIFEENGWSWINQGFRINKAMDSYIASDDPNDTSRSPEAPVISVLKSVFKNNTLSPVNNK